jgi:transcription initiation factor IIE alpha subunit
MSDAKLQRYLAGIISDGFNRSLNALSEAGAVDTRKLRQHYKGIGSKYYDIVTQQIELSAKIGAAGLRQALEEDDRLTENRPNKSL